MVPLMLGTPHMFFSAFPGPACALMMVQLRKWGLLLCLLSSFFHISCNDSETPRFPDGFEGRVAWRSRLVLRVPLPVLWRDEGCPPHRHGLASQLASWFRPDWGFFSEPGAGSLLHRRTWAAMLGAVLNKHESPNPMISESGDATPKTLSCKL